MRSFVLFAAALSTGCSTVPPEAPAPNPSGPCSEAGLDRFAGRQADAQLGAEILQQSGARALRWIPKGSAVTMDYRSDRVNVKLDSANRVEGVTCG